MKNPLTWLVLACIAVGILAFLSIFKSCQSSSRLKSAREWEAKFNACNNAPRTIDTVYVPIEVHDTTWVHLWGQTFFIHDTTVKWCQAYYDSTYRFSNAQGVGRIHYALSVKDCNASIQFKDIVSPKEIITITQHVDTCITKPPEYKAKLFHWGLYTDLTLNNFKTFPGIGLGGQIIVKDQVTIGLGAAFLNGFYGNIRIGVLFK